MHFLFANLKSLGGSQLEKKEERIFCWTVKWDVTSRGYLLQLEEATFQWVALENEFRSSVSPHYCKDYGVESVELPDCIEMSIPLIINPKEGALNGKREFLKVLQGLAGQLLQNLLNTCNVSSAAFPEGCAKADVSYMRKMLTTERQRYSMGWCCPETLQL